MVFVFNLVLSKICTLHFGMARVRACLRNGRFFWFGFLIGHVASGGLITAVDFKLSIFPISFSVLMSRPPCSCYATRPDICGPRRRKYLETFNVTPSQLCDRNGPLQNPCSLKGKDVGDERRLDEVSTINAEKQVGHEKAQKAQRKERFTLAGNFNGWVTTVSTPFSLWLLCLFVAINGRFQAQLLVAPNPREVGSTSNQPWTQNSPLTRRPINWRSGARSKTQ